MRALLCPVLLSLAACAGCAATEPGACAEVRARLPVDEVHESSLLVDNGSLILHARGATVLLREDGGCTAIALADVRVGDRVGHDATQIATSYPAQAWPEHIVVERAA